MLMFKYHARTSGVMVRRGDETVVVEGGEFSTQQPNLDSKDVIRTSLTDGWVGMTWVQEHSEDLIWEWFKENGEEISREEAGAAPETLDAYSQKALKWHGCSGCAERIVLRLGKH